MVSWAVDSWSVGQLGSWPVARLPVRREKKGNEKKTKRKKKRTKVCDNMDSGAEERFLTAQAQANAQRLAMEKQMLAMQQGFKDSMEKQEREFKKFQEQQMAAAAAAMGTAAGGVGGRAGGVGGSCGVSEAGSSDTGRGRQKKKARVSGAGGKAAADAAEDKDDAEEDDLAPRLPCEYPGCTETFKICSTTRATMSNHMRYNHPQETGGLVLALVCCLHVLACACMCLHV